MGTIPPDEIARLWADKQLPVEEVAAYILQHLIRLQAAIEAHGRLLDSLRSDLDYLMVSASTASPVRTRKRRPRSSLHAHHA